MRTCRVLRPSFIALVQVYNGFLEKGRAAGEERKRQEEGRRPKS